MFCFNRISWDEFVFVLGFFILGAIIKTTSHMDEIDFYISNFPEEVQRLLHQIKTIIHEEAPEADEGIAYGMPAYKTNKKPLVYFAGFKNHIGLYATPSGHEAFQKELSEYKQGRGSVQFPLDQPIPFDLIRRIVAFRVEENKSLRKKRTPIPKNRGDR
jgi:uncharacterized protein YdhG (YjbR/CyaY superfamily)